MPLAWKFRWWFGAGEKVGMCQNQLRKYTIYSICALIVVHKKILTDERSSALDMSNSLTSERAISYLVQDHYPGLVAPKQKSSKNQKPANSGKTYFQNQSKSDLLR